MGPSFHRTSRETGEETESAIQSRKTIRQRVASFFTRSQLARRETASEHGGVRMLPFDVRYALQYKGARMGKSEIRALADSGFDSESLYLVLRILRKNQEAQREFLTNIITAFRRTDNGGSAEVIKHRLNLLDEDAGTLGTKVAQINRQGPELWQSAFGELATSCKDGNLQPFLIGNAALTGIKPFVRNFDRSDSPIYVLMPDQIEADSPTVGFQIDLSGDEVQVGYLARDFLRPDGAMLIDDTIRSGEHMRDMLRFWGHEHAQEQCPIPKIGAIFHNTSLEATEFDAQLLAGYTTRG